MPVPNSDSGFAQVIGGAASQAVTYPKRSADFKNRRDEPVAPSAHKDR